MPLGGAISNMYAMLIARFKMFPEVKEKGMAAVPRLIAFTSEHVGVNVLSKFKPNSFSLPSRHISRMCQGNAARKFKASEQLFEQGVGSKLSCHTRPAGNQSLFLTGVHKHHLLRNS
ncbi:hypothetical protein J1605_005067 [Eschrichtius robustus]|uniref:glutamate decarboxylase n=1 Tax=Eschrichtius robustus TaxID=9764 RepID=A0AB34H7K5_ESCRO|nr:hypothetical protein J1605_005067 [Eschrichtius robustus]